MADPLVLRRLAHRKERQWARQTMLWCLLGFLLGAGWTMGMVYWLCQHELTASMQILGDMREYLTTARDALVQQTIWQEAEQTRQLEFFKTLERWQRSSNDQLTHLDVLMWTLKQNTDEWGDQMRLLLTPSQQQQMDIGNRLRALESK